MTNIHDVARRAGVAPVTVSRVINGASNVNAGTREKVEQAIRELGYVPNLSARSLRSRQTATLALIVPDVTNAFWTTVARGVEDAAQAESYSVLLCNTDESLSKQTGYINAVLQQRVDGVIIAPYDSDPQNLKPLRMLKTPVVVLDRRVEGWEVDTVRTDSISGGYALTRHLLALGHRQIAMISGPPVTSTAEDRVSGYCLALAEAGISIDPRLVRRGEYRAASGRLLTDGLLDEGIAPTAIIAANNLVAMGVLESLQNHGKTVPQDIALVCFDELPDLARFFPFLTVVAQPAYDMGINAAQLLLSRIGADAPLHPRQVILPSRLILRYSCGRFLRQPDTEPATLTPLKDRSETILIRPLAKTAETRAARQPGGYPAGRPGSGEFTIDQAQPDAGRLMKVLLHQAVDRIPHVEARIASTALLEYVLQRSLPYSQPDLESGEQAIDPLDYLEFALRVGLDAVPCEINWRLDFPLPVSPQEIPERVTQAFPPPALTDVFNRVEGYLRAVQGSRIGVYLSFSGFFEPALQAAGIPGMPLPAEVSEAPVSSLAILRRMMDMLMLHQEKVVRAICDRFAADLAFAVIRDNLFGQPGVEPQTGLFQNEILPRLLRLIAPIREHSLPVGLNTGGPLAQALPVLFQHGLAFVQSPDPHCNDLRALHAAWRDRFTFIGGFPLASLASESRESVEGQAAEFCQGMAKGGFMLGASGDISAEVRPELFLALAHAAQRCSYSSI